MSVENTSTSQTSLTPAQAALQALWEEHMADEFAVRDTEATLSTMVADAYVNHIPVRIGGVVLDQLREFYSKHFIPQVPPDTEIIPVSRTIGTAQLVDEMVLKFMHTIRMDWILSGVVPTEKRVEVSLVAIVRFRDGKLAHEHIYWDQASVLVQLGLIDANGYGIVLSGEIDLELDAHTEIHLKAGDCIIQNGTRHAWRNRGAEACTIAFIIIGATQNDS
jgi:carboxymethylenebutenolidase